jgi:hypothetical protein
LFLSLESKWIYWQKYIKKLPNSGNICNTNLEVSLLFGLWLFFSFFFCWQYLSKGGNNKCRRIVFSIFVFLYSIP